MNVTGINTSMYLTHQEIWELLYLVIFISSYLFCKCPDKNIIFHYFINSALIHLRHFYYLTYFYPHLLLLLLLFNTVICIICISSCNYYDCFRKNYFTCLFSCLLLQLWLLVLSHYYLYYVFLRLL